MKRFADFALRRPVTTLMVFISFLVIGSIAGRLVPLEFMPDMTFPVAFVQAPYPGSTPEETERLITRPIEEAVATINEIEFIRSNSGENEASVFVRFKMGTDIRMKSVELQEKIDGIRNQLPDDLERVYVNKFSAQDMPIMNLRISSDRDLSNAYDLLYRNLVQPIERLEGVAQVNLHGVQKKEIRIELDPQRLAAYNVDLNQLSNQLRQANFSLTAGEVKEAGKKYIVRPVGEITDTDQMSNLVIGPNNLKLSDIATVKYQSPERDYGRHLDRTYAISLEVLKESGANTVATADRVLSKIEQVNENPEMQGIQIYEMHNQASGIISSLEELFKAGLLGACLSLIVLYLFLRKFSTTLIVSMAVPFSLIVTLAFMYFLGLTLNVLSMMGLMLAVGMLVDNAVVITENIHRHQLMGDDTRKATISGVSEVAMAVTAGTLTSIIVFLPNIISDESMLAVQLYHVAVTICIALLASLLISQTVIPLLTSKVKPPQPKETSDFFDRISEKYGRLLNWLIHHRYASAGLILATIFSVAIPLNLVKTDMFERVEGRELRLHYNINGNYTLERVEESVDRIEEYLYANKTEFDIKSVYTYYETGSAMSTIILTDEDSAQKSATKVKELIEKDLPKISLGQPSFEFMDRSGGDQLKIHLIGESSDALFGLVDNAIWRLEQIDGITDVRSEADEGSQEVQVVVDRARANRYDVSTQQIAQLVSGAMRGQRLRKLQDDQGEVDVVLAFQESNRQNIEDLMQTPVFINEDQSVKLSSLVDYRMSRGPQSIQRENRQTSLGITMNLDGLTSDEARTKISEVMDQMNFPSGYGWSYGRSFQQDQETMDEMLINMLLAIALIYLVMSALFESILYPSSIITSILFAVVGVYWFFLITGTNFSLMAMIGILILMGIVVNNGIVLIDHVHQLREKGNNRYEAIIQAGKDRLRPILMTAATTVLGLVPLCFGTTQIGGDGPPYFPMARAIVGGLTFSTLVTMVILPMIYIFLDDLKQWASYLWKHSSPTR
ncbi:MAG: efflux RND transporter permease subunit [Bacteroidota bacterium]